MGGASTVGIAAGVQGREGVLSDECFGCVGGEGLGLKLCSYAFYPACIGELLDACGGGNVPGALAGECAYWCVT
jgi:hypothetical protein